MWDARDRRWRRRAFQAAAGRGKSRRSLKRRGLAAGGAFVFLAGAGAAVPKALDSRGYFQVIRKEESLQAEWVQPGSGQAGTEKACGVRVNWENLELEFYCRREEQGAVLNSCN
ncbi:MAG: hypothetical protein Q4C73_09575 [Eubacteriales bacterium]|nr:hypothetical protein [Eubacteriales bacterium]